MLRTRTGHAVRLRRHLLATTLGATVLQGLVAASWAQGVVIQNGNDVVVPTAIGDDLKPTTSENSQAPAPAARQTPAPAPQPKPQAAKKPAPAKQPKPASEQTAARKDTAKPETTGAIAKGDKALGGSEQSIIALVNDEPITGYEVRQRAQMMSGGAAAEYVKNNIQARWKATIANPAVQDEFKAFAQRRQPKSREELAALQKEFVMAKQKAMVAQLQAEAQSRVGSKMRGPALEELIDEKLKMQEAKRVGAVASDDEIDKIVDGIAQRNKMTKEQLAQQMGGSLEPMRYRVRSTLAWNEVVRRKFGRDVSIATKDVDKYVATAHTAGDDDVELQVQRIRITVPAKVDQQGFAQRVSEAEAIRGKFTGCKATKQLASGIAGAQFEDLGKRRPSGFQEPTRSMLLNAKDDEMLPPAVEDGGINLFAVCGRTVVKAEEQKRVAAEGELKQKELELLAKRHLKDLRQDAHIEYR